MVLTLKTNVTALRIEGALFRIAVLRKTTHIIFNTYYSHYIFISRGVVVSDLNLVDS